MNEIAFHNWAAFQGMNRKVVSDSISRLKKLENEFDIDIDLEYKKDQCNYMLSLFNHTGKNDEMKKYKTNLPIGQYRLSTYKYALNLYIRYLASIEKNNYK